MRTGKLTRKCCTWYWYLGTKFLESKKVLDIPHTSELILEYVDAFALHWAISMEHVVKTIVESASQNMGAKSLLKEKRTIIFLSLGNSSYQLVWWGNWQVARAQKNTRASQSNYHFHQLRLQVWEATWASQGIHHFRLFRLQDIVLGVAIYKETIYKKFRLIWFAYDLYLHCKDLLRKRQKVGVSQHAMNWVGYL